MSFDQISKEKAKILGACVGHIISYLVRKRKWDFLQIGFSALPLVAGERF